ncbi:MAG: Dyp-type peroxidase [Deltaproteobacteria bacterium]|nr:Dyp-type peroxidase [Deltaproteobacteria bacterium]
MTTRPEPQIGIVPEPASEAHFLVLRLRDRARDARTVARALAALPELAAEMDPGARPAKLAVTIGIGPELWEALAPDARPRALRQFKALEAGGRRAPATGGDVLLHVTSALRDLTFDFVLEARRRLGDRVEVAEDVMAFRRQDARDLTGFIDGTENPKELDERAEWALVGDDDPAFAGGSYVFTQRYVHDLAAWRALSVAEQEDVIGRRKPDSEELADDVKPPTSHAARSNLTVGEEELKIVRQSLPYGDASEAGLFFIAYCRTPDIPERMLARMMGTSGDGVHDRLMEFSRAVSGAHFFAPSLPVLRRLGGAGA